MVRSAHIDTFAADALPPRSAQPEFLLEGLDYPDRINAVSALLDSWCERGEGHRSCLIGAGIHWSYAETAERVNRIAHVLTRDLGLVPGNRVLLRGPNSPMLVAIYFAVLKAGGVVVATMPMLRAKELAYPISKAKIALAFCDSRLTAELEAARALAPELQRIVTYGTDGALERLMADAPDTFEAVDTAAEDIALIGFTSGTTGQPKGTMHNHRDLLATCDTYGRQVLRAEAGDVFIGSPPLAFTFGLGGLVLFPMRVGASTVLLERATPDDLLPAIAAHRASVLFTAPTAYRAMLGKLGEPEGTNISSLRRCVSAGEALPRATFDAWKAATGLPLMDGIGATEMLHIFISAPADRIRPGSTGLVVPGYEARIMDEAGAEVARGTLGRLAVRGPTGCRYLADDRQAKYVQNGWNVTGDTYIQDQDGYFWYQARSDDMIVSAGYNISGPEVEASLLTHPAVAECGVVGVPDPERGMVVKAFVVLKPGLTPDDAATKLLQDHVKADIAPYKYPRQIEFVERLPRTETGKLQRFQLRATMSLQGKAP
jgi:2-aminobenzoate-CoA ligase